MRRHAIKINGHDTPVMRYEKNRNSDPMEHPCEGWGYDFVIETPDREWRIPLVLPNPLNSRGTRALKPSDIEEIVTDQRTTEVVFRTGEKIQPVKEPVIRNLTDMQQLKNRTILKREYDKHPGVYRSLYSPYIAVGDSWSEGRSKTQQAEATPELEAEIIRMLSRDFPNLERPTCSQFYQEYIINGCKLKALAEAHQGQSGWSYRTLKGRKHTIEQHLTEKLGISVDLDQLRTASRRAGRIVATDPGIIERTHTGDDSPE